jgi:hypothetical protein
MPSFTYQALTELEAVNLMLSTIGESPVSTLEVSGDLNVSVARQMLYDVSREVQTIGWYFNTDVDYSLPLDVSGNINVGGNVLSLDLSDINSDIYSLDVVQRGSRLYNRKGGTYVFTSPLYADITWFLPWDDMPQAARQYVAIVASRRFQRRLLGDDVSEKVTAVEEAQAKATLEDFDANTRDYNLADSYGTFMITGLNR